MNSKESPLGHTPKGWSIANLKDITTKIGSGATPRGGKEVYLEERETFALIRSQNVFDRYFSTEGLAYISDEHAEQLSQVWLQPNDILLNITGDGITFSRACIVPQNILPSCVNQHVSIIRVNPSICDAGFILSYLTHPQIKHYIESFNAGGSRRAITKGHIESFEVPLPPLVEQKAIAAALSAFDDKIELNRQMNATLEEMARALFKSWFVDFDPVQRNQTGAPSQPYDHLFPDELVESEGRRKIPSGWQIGQVEDLGEIVTGKTPSTRNPENYGGDIPFITIPDMRGNVFVTETSKTLTQKGANTQLNKTLQPNSVCVSCIATPGLVAMNPTEAQTNQQINSIIPKNDYSSFYCYFLLRMLGDEIRARGSSGSVYLNLNKSQFSVLPVLLPSPEVVMIYHDLVAPIFARLLLNDRESRTLAELRDTLLPRLMSGQLRIPLS